MKTTSGFRFGRTSVLALFSVLLFSVLSQAAMAQAKSLGTFGDWTAWESSDASGRICFIAAQPNSSRPTNVNRSAIHFIVTHRVGGGVKNEASTRIGYPFKEGSVGNASIDGQNYSLITHKENAWLAAAADNGPFVGGMKRGAELVITGTSSRGTRTTDTYSLKGVTAAVKLIDEKCG